MQAIIIQIILKFAKISAFVNVRGYLINTSRVKLINGYKNSSVNLAL